MDCSLFPFSLSAYYNQSSPVTHLRFAMLFTILVVVFAALLFLLAFVLVRTLGFARPLPLAEPALEAEIDPSSAAAHLAEAVRCKTISTLDGNAQNTDAFQALHNALERMYPRVHQNLRREVIGSFSLLYTWRGAQPDLPGVLLMAHQDVVPVDEATLDKWEHPPFSGAIADGYIYGRGTLDCKHQLIAVLEAVEHLLETGFQPQRTVFLAFGDDEELGGYNGAQAIVEHLRGQGVRLQAVLDEGGILAEGILPGVAGAAALVGIGEKGYLTLELKVEGTPGHSSSPPQHTAIGILAKAIAHLEANPLPARPAAMIPMMRGLGSAAPFLMQMAFANLWLFGGLVKRIMLRSPKTAAAIRTTTAVTVISGGVRDNVLPAEAKAHVNFRLLPGDSIAGVCEHARAMIKDERVRFEPVGPTIAEASPLSPDTGAVFDSLSRTVRAVFGAVPVAPYLVLGMTDARHYTALCEHVYRLSPVLITAADLERVHGNNERISIAGLGKMVQFYTLLIRRWTADVEA